MTKKKPKISRREQILDTTMEVLAFEGDASVTMRGIADRVGIRLSTLQYHFPNKQELLRCTIEKCIGSVISRMEDIATRSKLDPIKKLRKVLKLHLTTSCDLFVSKFFSAIWALASHDKDVEKLLNEIYKRDCERYAGFIHHANPKLSKKTCETRAMLLLAQLEGLVLFITPGRLGANQTKALEKELDRVIDQAILQ